MRASNEHDIELRANLFWFELQCIDEQIEALKNPKSPREKRLLDSFRSRRHIISQLARPPK